MLERDHIYKNRKTNENVLNGTYAENKNTTFEIIHKYGKKYMATAKYHKIQ
jgi:hypothetical protein